MSNDIFPQATRDLAATRKKLVPQIHDAFTTFSERVFDEGALPTKTKQLIAIAGGARHTMSVLHEPRDHANGSRFSSAARSLRHCRPR
jgi:hypothetical protein